MQTPKANREARSSTQSRSGSGPPRLKTERCPDNWEDDLITGFQNTHIATLVEGTSRFTLLVKVKGKDTERRCWPRPTER